VGEWMSNKVCLVADVHLGVRKNKDIFMESQMRFFTDVLVPYLRENNIDTIAILGDLFDNRNALNVMVKNEAFKLFDEILKDFTIYLLVGNHDSYFNSSIDVNSLKFFGKFSNVILVEKNDVYELGDTVKKNVYMVPWVTDNNKFYQDIQTNSEKCDLCFGHFNITGGRMNKVKCSDNGFQKDTFKSFSKVFTGHFHSRSSQSTGDCEIVYVGSPYQFNRGDMDEDRGFVILDLETNDYEYINNDKSLKFVKVSYPDKLDETVIGGNLVDVYVDTSTTINQKDVEKYMSKLEGMNPADEPVVYFVNYAEDTESKFKLTVNNIGSVPDMMKSYLNTLPIQLKNEVNDYLLELYNEVRGCDDE